MNMIAVLLRLRVLPYAIVASGIGFIVWLVTWPEEFRVRVHALFGIAGPYEGRPPERYDELRETFGRDPRRRIFHNLKSITEALIDYDPQGWSKLFGFLVIVAFVVGMIIGRAMT